MSGVADDGVGPNKKWLAISSGNLTSVKEQDTDAYFTNISEEKRYACFNFASCKSFFPMCNLRKMNMFYANVNFPNCFACYFKHDRVVHTWNWVMKVMLDQYRSTSFTWCWLYTFILTYKRIFLCSTYVKFFNIYYALKVSDNWTVILN